MCLNHKTSQLVKALICFTLIISGCSKIETVEKENKTIIDNRQKVAKINLNKLSSLHAPKALPAHLKAEPTMPAGVLPKYKTASEKAADKRRKSRGNGMVLRDQFDDFRQQYIDYYYVTDPPTASASAAAEYTESQAWLISWPYSLGTKEDQFMASQIKAGWGIAPLILVYDSSAQAVIPTPNGNLQHLDWLKLQLQNAGLNPNDSTKVSYFDAPADSIWARDFGPISILSNTTTPVLSFVDFRYYHQRVFDDHIPSAIAFDWNINVYRPDLEFEGGNFMNTTNGVCASSKGIIWFNNVAQSVIEQIYKDYLGCKSFVFPTPLTDEGTTHLDMFSKFADDTHVIVGEYTSSQDAGNKSILDANASAFASVPNMTVYRIPMPNNDNRTNWRTYTNSLTLKGPSTKAVIYPVYSDETSYAATAYSVYQKAFPGWTITGVDSSDVIPWGGAVHCTTMQIAKGSTVAKMEGDPASLCTPKAASCGGANACGDITGEGCCDGDILKYCTQAGTVEIEDCSTSPQCGWSSSVGYYECGTAGGEDPTKINLRRCPTSATQDSGVTPVDAGLDTNVVVDQSTAHDVDVIYDSNVIKKDSTPVVDQAVILNDQTTPPNDQSIVVKDQVTADAAANEEKLSGGGCQLTNSDPTPLFSAFAFFMLCAFVRRRRNNS